MKKLFFLLFFCASAQAAVPSISCTPSRNSGVAPLFVFLDCTATTDDGTSNPFHDIYYEHSLDDPISGAAGLWPYGANTNASKNFATGAVAGHVFETAGTYTITSRACDATGCSQTTNSITVTSADSVFPTTSTICISADTDPTPGSGGCPAGAAHYQQSNFATIISTYATSSVRILLKRGNTFTTAAESRITGNGPGILGAYGTGAKPQVNATAEINTGILGFNASNNTTYTWGDWRVMDMSMNGGGYTDAKGPGITASSGGYVSLLMLRVDLKDFETGFGFGLDQLNWNNNANGRHMVADQLGIFDSTTNLTTTGLSNTSYSGYNGGNRIAFMGNRFDNSGNLYRYDETDTVVTTGCGGGSCNGSHLLRFTYCNLCVVSHNHLLRPGGNRLNIKLHSPQVADAGSTYSADTSGEGYTKYVIIADNYLQHGGSGDAENIRFIVAGPQDAANDERGHDIIIERNFELGHVYTSQFNLVHWPAVSVRNNIAVAAGTPNYTIFLQVAKEGGEPSLDHVWVRNNTVYKATGISNNADGFTLVDIPDTSPSYVWITNNLAYVPTLTGSVVVADAGITGLTTTTNTSNINSDNPSFANAGGTAPIDYRPTVIAAYPATGGTAAFPITQRDFFNCLDKTGVVRRGALVPKSNARCSGGK